MSYFMRAKSVIFATETRIGQKNARLGARSIKAAT